MEVTNIGICEGVRGAKENAMRSSKKNCSLMSLKKILASQEGTVPGGSGRSGWCASFRVYKKADKSSSSIRKRVRPHTHVQLYQYPWCHIGMDMYRIIYTKFWIESCKPDISFTPPPYSDHARGLLPPPRFLYFALIWLQNDLAGLYSSSLIKKIPVNSPDFDPFSSRK